MPSSAQKSSTSAARASRTVELCRRGELRVEKFLDAATDVFAEKGYQQARLSEIVARAGGSLATLYRAFGDKEGLAFAIVERRLQDLANQLEALELDGLPPQDALRKAGRSIAQSLTTRDAYLVNRIVIGEGRAFPDLRDFYFDHAIATIRSRLGSYFERQVAAGTMVLHTSADLAATQFFMMLFGDLTIRTACGYMANPDTDNVLAFIDGSVEQFLHGALPR
jgi:AcrR family transcriptional regulator